MTLGDVLKRIEVLNLPVAYLEFKASKKNPPPMPPYLIYFCSEIGRGADCKVNLKEKNVSIELYTDTEPDFELEEKIEKLVLFDIEYQKYQAVTEEKMVQTAYEFNLIEKVRA